MKKVCTKCGKKLTQPDWLRAKGGLSCLDCHNTYQREYRRRRKDQGNPVKSGKPMPREWHQAYEERYRERPGVRTKLAARARERRADPTEQYKMGARRILRTAIETGKMKRQPCAVCGKSPADGHHDNYAKPLEVRWLCRIHHVAEHAKAKVK